MKKIKILFIGDTLSLLKVASDTSLAFCEAALNLNFEVFWCETKDISFLDHEIFVNAASRITHASREKFKYTHDTHDKKEFPLPFAHFTYCFIRKDPPFDEAYKDLCWILNTQTAVKVYNSPSSLLNYHEKALPWRAYADHVLQKHNIVPTCLSHSVEIVENFLSRYNQDDSQKFITKPWLGHGGAEVKLWENAQNLIEYVQKSPHLLMIQPFLEEIYTLGDRRVLMVNGKIACSFVRLPSNDQIASNLARGGIGVLKEMTSEQIKICEKIGSFLLQHNIALAGIDLIGEKVGEINITSPTGFRAYEQMTGKHVIQKAFEEMIDFHE